MTQFVWNLHTIFTIMVQLCWFFINILEQFNMNKTLSHSQCIMLCVLNVLDNDVCSPMEVINNVWICCCEWLTGLYDKIMLLFIIICNLLTINIWFILNLIYNRLISLWFDIKEQIWLLSDIKIHRCLILNTLPEH